MKISLIVGSTLFSALLACSLQVSAQRASEKPIPAFYIQNMEQKRAAGQRPAASRNDLRASQKPLSAFYTAEMVQRQNSRIVRPSSPNQPRASQKPLDAFFTGEMRKRQRTQGNPR